MGVIVGAGLSSGQDLLQYFISFGGRGIIGVVLLAVMNIIFGRIMVTLGCHYQSENHQDVLSEIAGPITNRLIDITLVIGSFVMGFVMVAGAGSNVRQQFGLPAWTGALICSILIVAVAFLDFDKILAVLGVFTPVIVVMILLITAYTFAGKTYDFKALSDIAETVPSAMPSVGISVVNYYAICAMSGVSMAFILGGSVVRIGTAEKGGTLGGIITGVIITAASLSIFANIGLVKDSDMPMLEIVNRINPVLALIYAFTIFALIFNTAFSLYYAIARRIAGDDKKKMRKWMIIIAAAGFGMSFMGFKDLIGYMYPVIGYMGILLLLVLAVAWIKNRNIIEKEKQIRRKMIRLVLKKHYRASAITMKDIRIFHILGRRSAADTELIEKEVKDYAGKVAEETDDIKGFVKKDLPVDENIIKKEFVRFRDSRESAADNNAYQNI